MAIYLKVFLLCYNKIFKKIKMSKYFYVFENTQRLFIQKEGGRQAY